MPRLAAFLSLALCAACAASSGTRGDVTAAVTSGAGAGMNEAAVPLATLHAADVRTLLFSWSLRALADCLFSEEVDGDTLAFAAPGEFELTVESCPRARPHHWSKFWRRLEALRTVEDMRVVVPRPEPVALDASSSSSSPPPPPSGVEVDADGGSSATARSRRRLGVDPATGFGGLQIAMDASMVAFGAAMDTVLFRSGPGELTLNGTLIAQPPGAGSTAVSLVEDVLGLRQAVANLTAHIADLERNVSRLAAHDFVYTWFQDGWFTLPAHHASDDFTVDDHSLEPILCDAAHRGMMFYDVTGNTDGVCICSCKSDNSVYAWFDIITGSFGTTTSCN